MATTLFTAVEPSSMDVPHGMPIEVPGTILYKPAFIFDMDKLTISRFTLTVCHEDLSTVKFTVEMENTLHSLLAKSPLYNTVVKMVFGNNVSYEVEITKLVHYDYLAGLMLLDVEGRILKSHYMDKKTSNSFSLLGRKLRLRGKNDY